MACTPCYCPHPPCTPYGPRGFGTPLVHCGADRGMPRLLCTMCKGTFSVRQGPAYFGVRAEAPHDTIAMRALAEGMLCEVPAGSSMSIRIPSVLGWTEPDGIAGR